MPSKLYCVRTSKKVGILSYLDIATLLLPIDDYVCLSEPAH